MPSSLLGQGCGLVEGREEGQEIHTETPRLALLEMYTYLGSGLVDMWLHFKITSQC